MKNNVEKIITIFLICIVMSIITLMEEIGKKVQRIEDTCTTNRQYNDDKEQPSFRKNKLYIIDIERPSHHHTL